MEKETVESVRAEFNDAINFALDVLVQDHGYEKAINFLVDWRDGSAECYLEFSLYKKAKIK